MEEKREKKRDADLIHQWQSPYMLKERKTFTGKKHL